VRHQPNTDVDVQWLGKFGGAGPISSDGQVIATTTIGGIEWQLYYGSHSQMEVYSFTIASGNVESFSGDLKLFADYLVANYGVAETQLVLSVGGGTEPFEGVDVSFNTSRYVAAIS
jgi:xyloglucan-specific endo-beta-1,4-glucanase